MVTQHQKALSSSQQPTLNKEDEQSSILRFMELHYYQLSMIYRPLKEIFRGTFSFRNSSQPGREVNGLKIQATEVTYCRA